MSKQYFGVYTLHPADVWSSNFENTCVQKDAAPMLFFDSSSAAFDFIKYDAKQKSMPATITGIGSKQDEYLRLPGVGIMHNVLIDEQQIAAMPAVRISHGYGDAIKGYLSNTQVLESLCIMQCDDFHQQVLPVSMAEARQALSERYQCYQLLEQTLVNTPSEIRRSFSANWLSDGPLRMVYGPDGMIQNDFSAAPDSDKLFMHLMKTLWEHDASLPYFDRAAMFYNRYHDVYMRDMAMKKGETLSQLHAAQEMMKLIRAVSEELHDYSLEDVLQKKEDVIESSIRDIEREEFTEK